jgi:DNA primase
VAFAREDIERVKERTDLAELAAEVTKVKRTGRSVMAVCPFHNEKTPSLSIDPARGLYHCFGCGKGGDVVRWIQDTQNLDFNDAIEVLARRVGVELKEEPGAKRRRSRREALVAANEAAVDFFHERMRTASDAANARSYLRSRGYDAEIVSDFRIGYSPDTWDSLANHLTEQGIERKIIEAAGLASKSSRGTLIDRFRGRVMFPIYDLRGDAVGFGARLLEGDGAKYLNTAETQIYHKSRLLYGLNWAKSGIVKANEAVVVEGYTDVIAFHQAGMPVAVATCGTALGEEHLDLLRRFSERVVLAFDSDEAGANAALRGFEKSVPGDLDLRVAIFPSGRDPADLVKDGETAQLTKAIEESIPMLQFRIEQELGKYDLNEAEARGRAVSAAAALVATHPNEVVRHEYAILLARRTGADRDVVDAAVRRAARRTGAAEEAPPPSRSRIDRSLTGGEKAERRLLRLLLANEPAVRDFEVDAEMFGAADARAAYEFIAPEIDALEPGVAPDLGRMLSGDDDVTALLRHLAMVEDPPGDAEELVNRLKVGAVERRIERVNRQLAEMPAEGEEYSELMRQLIALQHQRRELRSHS